MFKGILSNFGNKNERFKELEDEHRMKRKLEAKQLTSNERELRRFEEEERQRYIKQKLEQFRVSRREEERKTNMLASPNVFDHTPTVLRQDKSVMTNSNSQFQHGGLI